MTILIQHIARYDSYLDSPATIPVCASLSELPVCTLPTRSISEECFPELHEDGETYPEASRGKPDSVPATHYPSIQWNVAMPTAPSVHALYRYPPHHRSSRHHRRYTSSGYPPGTSRGRSRLCRRIRSLILLRYARISTEKNCISHGSAMGCSINHATASGKTRNRTTCRFNCSNSRRRRLTSFTRACMVSLILVMPSGLRRP